MACEDLRHVCGKCGFRWPERSAYDEQQAEIMRLRDALAVERARAIRDERDRVVARLRRRSAEEFRRAEQNDGVNNEVATRCSKAGAVLRDEAGAIGRGES